MKKQPGFQRVTEDQAIAGFLRSLGPQVRQQLADCKEATQETWMMEALVNYYQKPSDIDLFSPHSDSFTSWTRTIDGTQTLFTRKGFWGLQLPVSNRLSQFTITVKVGRVDRFKPYDIKRSFRQWFPDDEWQDRYLHWKQQVLDDLDSAHELIEMADPCDHLASMTCCESSERLCRKLGLRVEHGLAFLFRKGSIAVPAANGIRNLRRNQLS